MVKGKTKYEKQAEGELVLTNYIGLYGNLIVTIFFSLAIFLVIIYPGVHAENLFAVFIEAYQHKNFLGFLSILIIIGLFIYSAAQFFIVPSKIIFSEEGIRVFSVHAKGTYFIMWEDLTELQFIRRFRTRYQVKRESMQIVIAANNYSTKILGSLGPNFRLYDFLHNNVRNREDILELYKRKCPQGQAT